MKVDLLFVYGTLRRAVGHPSYRLLERNADPLGAAEFQGRLYLVADYPGAVPSANSTDRVRGELYRLRDGQLLEQLDRYEECGPEFALPTEYRRCQKIILTATGDRLRGWIYLYNRPTEHLSRICSGDYLAHLEGHEC